MTELQAAVGLAQMEKVGGVVARRQALGTLLSHKSAGLAGVAGAPVTPGSEHSYYWLYPLRVRRWSPQRFAAALTAEGVPAGSGYIGQPLFLCAEALAGQQTFGASGFPFSALPPERQVAYSAETCPRAQEALDHMVTLSLNENCHDTDIADMAAAIEKVARLLPPDSES
jgi:dTDP-4-amino-4,6-dideoxygalactose transaminase